MSCSNLANGRQIICSTLNHMPIRFFIQCSRFIFAVATIYLAAPFSVALIVGCAVAQQAEVEQVKESEDSIESQIRQLERERSRIDDRVREADDRISTITNSKERAEIIQADLSSLTFSEINLDFDKIIKDLNALSPDTMQQSIIEMRRIAGDLNTFELGPNVYNLLQGMPGFGPNPVSANDNPRLVRLVRDVQQAINDFQSRYQPREIGLIIYGDPSQQASSVQFESARSALISVANLLKDRFATDTQAFKEKLTSLVENTIKEIDGDLTRASEQRDALIRQRDEQDAKIFGLQQRLQDLRQKLVLQGEELAKWTLVIWFTAIVFVITALLILTKLLINKGLPPNVNHGFLLEIVSLFVITAAILILGLGNKLNEQSLAALLGGVAGYLFGRTQRDDGIGRGLSRTAEQVVGQREAVSSTARPETERGS